MAHRPFVAPGKQEWLWLLGADWFAEVPGFVVYVYGGYFFGRERNVAVAADLDDAAFAGDNLVEVLAVFQGDRDDVIADAGFPVMLKQCGVFVRNWG
jgi:hypothetical protein